LKFYLSRFLAALRILLLLSPVIALSALAQSQAAPSPIVVLPAGVPSVVPKQWLAAVAEPGWTIQDAIASPQRFSNVSSNTQFALDARQVLWLKLQVQAEARTAWTLALPMPVLDLVTLYERDEAGRWIASSAGDHLHVNQWPEGGRYPFFRLDLRGSPVTEIYLRVQHSTALVPPVRFMSLARYDDRSHLEYLGLGMALGALALLVAGSVMRTWTLRDRAYAWFSAHALLSTLAVAAFTGVAAQWLWPDWRTWVDAAPGCLAMVAGATALLVIRDVAALTTRHPALSTLITATGVLGPVLALGYLFLDRRFGIVLLGAYLFAVAVITVLVAALTWRRGDPVGRWMVLGSVPLALAVLLAVARVYNWIGASWLTEYSVVIALTFDLPMLLAALNSRSRERRASKLREIAASNQDPLTGMLKGRPFAARLQQAILRFEKRGEGAALLVIDVANHDWIKTSGGAEAAEQSLLRAVIKLRKLVRDVDTTARLGEARFGVLLEGVSSRAIVTEFATRLIALGLMAEPDSPSEPVLQFHAAAMLLHEFQPLPASPVTALSELLAAMSPRTRRPFRILDAQQYSGGTSTPGEDQAVAEPA